MPLVFLNPSMQQKNEYLGGGDEQYYMNRIVDEMEPYLRTNGIQFVRCRPGASLGQAIRESNAGYYDLHLTLHSNVSPENLAGRLMGADIFYFTYGARGKRAAEIIAENYKKIYPDPILVKAVPTNRMAEVTKTNAPAALVETAYHDNSSDVEWLKNSIDTIAVNLVESLTLYFNIPFISKPMLALHGKVDKDGGSLGIHTQPDVNSSVITQVPNGSPVAILGLWHNWYVLDYKGNVGYVNSMHILI